MIPPWLEKWEPLLPDLEMYTENLKGKEKMLALFREVIRHYFWLYQNLDITPAQDEELQRQFQWMDQQLKESAQQITKAGANPNRDSQRVRQLYDELMPLALKQRDPLTYLRDTIRQREPALGERADVARICREKWRKDQKRPN